MRLTLLRLLTHTQTTPHATFLLLNLNEIVMYGQVSMSVPDRFWTSKQRKQGYCYFRNIDSFKGGYFFQNAHDAGNFRLKAPGHDSKQWFFSLNVQV